jgi:hypothetical protein
LLLANHAHGWRVIRQTQRHTLNVATERNRDVLTDIALFCAFAVTAGIFQTVADKEGDKIACAFGAVLNVVTTLRRAAGFDGQAFGFSALDGLFDFGLEGFVFWFNPYHFAYSLKVSLCLNDKEV